MSKSFELEFVHKDLYGIAIEVVRKFVGKELSRPVLTYALHDKNGDMLATDSHKAIHIKDIHGFKEDYLVNPKNHMFARGDFPDLYKVIGSENHKKSITLNKEQLKLWLQIFRSINNTFKMMKSISRNKCVNMSFADNSVMVEAKIDHENSFKTILPVSELVKPEFDVITVSSEIMRDALEAHFKLNSDIINIYFHGQMRPIIMNDEIQVKTIVLPVRTFQ